MRQSDDDQQEDSYAFEEYASPGERERLPSTELELHQFLLAAARNCQHFSTDEKIETIRSAIETYAKFKVSEADKDAKALS